MAHKWLKWLGHPWLPRVAASMLLYLSFFSFVAPVLAGEWRVYFSPNGGGTEAVVQTLRQAQKSVNVQAYSFTSAPIAKALVEAHKRGVKVEAILDKSNRTAKYSSADFLVHAGIPTYIDAAHAIAHDKVMVIDGQTVITGSFNFTKAAERENAENLLVIEDVELAGLYLENWRKHAAHTEKYQGKDQPRDRSRRQEAPREYGIDYLLNLFKKVFEDNGGSGGQRR